MEVNMSGSTNAHILVFPYPAQGHMIPLLNLTHQLAKRGLTITLLVTPKNLPSLNPLLAAWPSTVKPLVFPFPSNTSIPPGVENTFDLPASGFRAMKYAMSQFYDPLLYWCRSHHAPPVAIISDMFLGWTQRIATELGVRRYVFYPSGALAISVISSLWTDMPKRRNIEDEHELVKFDKIPNSPIYPWSQLSPIYRSYVEGDPVSESIKDWYQANMESYGAVFNSFYGLERTYLDYLGRELGHDRVWAVGPLLPPDDIGPVVRGVPNSSEDSEISSWLDMCQDRTVMYVCFGSQAVLTNAQMEALTRGLEKSGVRFLLCVKGATKGHVGESYGWIPSGFEDRTAGRGLVVRGWAPQVMILRHPAVGAFFTHCGWNSVLESLVAGVPMLGWPMGADQFSNTTLLDELKVAFTVCKGEGTLPDSDYLSRVFAEAMSERWADKWRRAEELRKAALDSIEEGGSSFEDLASLVKQLTG